VGSHLQAGYNTSCTLEHLNTRRRRHFARRSSCVSSDSACDTRGDRRRESGESPPRNALQAQCQAHTGASPKAAAVLPLCGSACQHRHRRPTRRKPSEPLSATVRQAGRAARAFKFNKLKLTTASGSQPQAECHTRCFGGAPGRVVSYRILLEQCRSALKAAGPPAGSELASGIRHRRSPSVTHRLSHRRRWSVIGAASGPLPRARCGAALERDERYRLAPLVSDNHAGRQWLVVARICCGRAVRRRF